MSEPTFESAPHQKSGAKLPHVIAAVSVAFWSATAVTVADHWLAPQNAPLAAAAAMPPVLARADRLPMPHRNFIDRFVTPPPDPVTVPAPAPEPVKIAPDVCVRQGMRKVEHRRGWSCK